jgi:peptidoglycan hydrolase CwlO-like protein
MLLIYLLIFLFLALIIYQLFFSNTVIEGLENSTETTSSTTNNTDATYQPYNMNDPNNALILGQQNAGNIEYLKQRVEDLSGIKERVDNMQENINSMQTQIDGLVQQQADYAQEIAGSQPAEITGTEGETIDSAEATVNQEEEEPNQ